MNILIPLKNNGASDDTIKNNDKLLRHLDKYTDLENPEAVKQFIASKNSDSYKRNLCLAYDKYCEYHKIEWQKPHYKQDSRIPRIPTTEQLEMLIAKARPILATKLTLSKETGLRPKELLSLRRKDIDMEQRYVYPHTAKHGAPRRLRISTNLREQLKAHIDKLKLEPSDKLFKGKTENYSKAYRQMRNRLAEKLCKPQLRTIRLYDFRHYFATMLYAKTRDILLVKQKLGHKKIQNTLIYTQLLNLEDDEWTCKTATTVKESQQLIEAGFEYVTDQDGLKLFRKRK